MAAKEFVDSQIQNNKIVFFSKKTCPFCVMAKKSLDLVKAEYLEILIEKRSDMADIQDYLLKITGGRTVPRVFINQKFVGGGSELKAFYESGELSKMVQ